MGYFKVSAAALLLCASASIAYAHGGSEHKNMDMDMSMPHSHNASNVTFDPNTYLYDKPSYAGLEAYSGLMMAHIGLMILGWFFILPVGVMFSIARSKLALAVQFLFLIVNALGVICGTMYNINTPDLYENNAHHKIGWIATWVFTAQVVMSLLFLYSGRNKQSTSVSSERASFLPASLQNMNAQSFSQPRWSGETQHEYEPASPMGSSRTLSPDREYEYSKPEAEDEPEDLEDVPLAPPSRRPSWFQNTKFDKYLSARVPYLASKKIVKIAEVVYEVIDRTILILGFIALLTGIVTYAGIFRANNIFNGLAHFVKGGIFFWYGLLTLGRWLGCFADFGWAWNVKPTKSEVGWKSRIPSAEFTESFVIWLYGCINVFLEHLAAWGGAWAAQDFEHVSISIMFFGGGLVSNSMIHSKKITNNVAGWYARRIENPTNLVECRSRRDADPY